VRTQNLVRAIGVLVAALLFGLVPVTYAHAVPVEEIEAEMARIWEKLEPAIEEYNNVHNQLMKNKAKSTELAKKIAPLQLQVDLALQKVGALAARYYKGGGTSALNALLTSGSPTTLAEQLTLLDQLAKIQQRQIANVFSAKEKFSAEKQKLDELIAIQAKQDADLAAKKKAIQTELNRLNQLRIQAYGSSSSGGSLRIGPCPALFTGGGGGTAAKTACAQIGKSYVFGSAGPNTFDCSGLTQYAWAAAGKHLSHFTGDQLGESTQITTSATALSNAIPGDLVFFYNDRHHVGLYVGNGLMVHASNPSVPIKMDKINNANFREIRRPK
jgi:cell wall-associated NlpC family hydrolase